MIRDDTKDINGRDLFYNRITGLRNSNVIVPMTKEQIEEVRKCRDDFQYFCENYFTIISLDKGKIKFKPRDYQIEFADLIENNRFVIAMLARQLGKGTIVTAKLVHMILFKNDYNILYLANDHKTSKEMLKRIKTAYEELPLWLQYGVTKWNETGIELENGSRIDSSACTPTAARGSSRNCLICDEFAFVPNTIANDFLSSVIPVISSGNTTKMIIFSTPNGFNAFSKIYHDAISGKNQFKHLMKTWKAIPERDEEWVKLQKSAMQDPSKFEQEHNCEFVGSSNTLLSAEGLNKLSSKPLLYNNDNLKIYEYPKENHKYIIGIDVSRGLGNDYTVMNVVDVTTIPYQQVAVHRSNNISTLLLPGIIAELGYRYNNAYLIIEGNDLGESVSNALWYGNDMTEPYDNILTTTKDPLTNEIIIGAVNKFRTCLITTKKTKMIGCNKLKALIEYDKLIVNDEDTVLEFYTFIANGNSYSAEEPNHDDCVMSLTLIAWTLTQINFLDEIESKDIYDKISEENYIPLPIFPENCF